MTSIKPVGTKGTTDSFQRTGHALSVYAMAVEQDRLFFKQMIKTMTPEQINKFCFENGFVVPTEQELKELSQ